ncbi:MAG TPA: GDP-mannose 4,6-dehydratase [Gemmatimonadaceae bacterium]|nr:GDP-mannose 4,6-dehydratase [Gemmatimonadaceae bacterium]
MTGAAGFVGQWLCQALLHEGWQVTGTVLGDVVPRGALSLEERRSVRWLTTDVRRSEELDRALEASLPDAIFHLAGVSYVPAATADPGAALDVNVIAAARLLAGVQRRRAAGVLDPCVVIVGSAEQYGRHDAQEMPLDESAAQLPVSVYGASKAAQEIVALEAFRHDGVRVVATRPFNHSGAGQADRFLLPALVVRALAQRDAWAPALSLGNTTPVRDLLHVADVVRAYLLLATQGVPGECYNIASGVGVDVATIAARVLALTGVDAKLESDPALVRPADVPVLVGDASKLRTATGWAPEHSLETIIDDLIRAATH